MNMCPALNFGQISALAPGPWRPGPFDLADENGWWCFKGSCQGATLRSHAFGDVDLESGVQ